eukprot:5752220-Pyramimonas_sp.AAC.1
MSTNRTPPTENIPRRRPIERRQLRIFHGRGIDPPERRAGGLRVACGGSSLPLVRVVAAIPLPV